MPYLYLVRYFLFVVQVRGEFVYMANPVNYGKRVRMSYSRINEVLEPPNLIEVQKTSFNWFMREGLKEVLQDVSPIEDYTGELVMELVEHQIGEDRKYTEEEAKDHDANYSAPLTVKVRLYNKSTMEIKQQEVFMGDMPMMTETGTFIINGAERVVVNQLVRSPGVYYKIERDKTGKPLYSSTLIPNRGAWIELESDSKDIVYTRIDRNRKIPMTILVRALGVETRSEIIELFGESEQLFATLEKDTTENREEAIIEIYKKLRPGEPPTLDSAESLFNNMFFEHKRYDLANVGRYKFNQKLSISERIKNYIAGENIIDIETGELLVTEGQLITKEIAKSIEYAGINHVIIFNRDNQPVKVLGNNFVDLEAFELDVEFEKYGLRGKVYYPLMKELTDSFSGDELEEEIEKNVKKLSPKHIIPDDILASVSYEMGLFCR